MPNIVNRMVTAELEHEFADAEGMVLVSYSGLETVENEELRGKLAEKNVGKAVLSALKTDGFPAEFIEQINWCRKRTILDAALERQVVSRAHRMGATGPVIVETVLLWKD